MFGHLLSFLIASFYVFTNRIFFIGTVSDLPSPYFCFCTTRVRSSSSELLLLLSGVSNIILLCSGMASKITATVQRCSMFAASRLYNTTRFTSHTSAHVISPLPSPSMPLQGKISPDTYRTNPVEKLFKLVIAVWLMCDELQFANEREVNINKINNIGKHFIKFTQHFTTISLTTKYLNFIAIHPSTSTDTSFKTCLAHLHFLVSVCRFDITKTGSCIVLFPLLIPPLVPVTFYFRLGRVSGTIFSSLRVTIWDSFR